MTATPPTAETATPAGGTLMDLRLPSLAESVVEGEVLAWLVPEGGRVTEGQSVLEIMTDKVTVELPSPHSGVLVQHVAPVGAVVAVGAVLARIDTGDGQPGSASMPPEPVQEAPTPPTATRQDTPPERERSIIESRDAGQEDDALVRAVFDGYTPPTREGAGTPAAPARVLAVPSARKLAREQGTDLKAVQGSGPNGVIRTHDLTAPASPGDRMPSHRLPSDRIPSHRVPNDWPPPPPPAYRTPDGAAHLETRTPYRGTRRAIGQTLLASTLHTAQTHSIEELDCTALTALRADLQPDAVHAGVKLSYLPFFLKAVATALHEYPALNSALDTRSGEIVQRGFVHLGVAVNTDAGLIVPVVRDVPHRSLLDLARSTTDLAERARNGTLRPADTQDATFTVSNIGAVGALVGVPIVTPPSVGILSLHSIVKRPVAAERDGQDIVVVRPMMYLTLSFDHRLVDGADAARFNRRVVDLLQHPQRLLLHL